MIDLEVMGIHINLRAANLIDRHFWSSLSIKVFITIQKARRSCKRWFDYRENTKCFNILSLVKNDSGSEQSIDKSSLFALLLVMRQSSTTCIFKLCNLESRLWRQPGVLKLDINKIWYNGHLLLLDAINKQCPPQQYSMPLVKQRFK